MKLLKDTEVSRAECCNKKMPSENIFKTQYSINYIPKVRRPLDLLLVVLPSQLSK